MKRAIVVYLLLCLIAPIAMEAKKKPFGNGLYWELTDDGTLIISGNGAMHDFNYDDSRPKVKAPWYKKGHFIKHVIIEDGITSIGAFSFYAYKGHYKGMQIIDHAYRNLQSVTLSSSVQDIGNVAFNYCESLSTVSINSKNTIGINDIHEHVIGMGAFADCDALVSIEIPAHITIIDQNAFRDCHNLKRVVMPNTVNIIERWAFDGCHNLSDLSIPNSVKEIGQHAFRGCKGPFIIPNSVKKIGSEAFAKCEGFVSINLPSSIEEIGSGAFKECKNLSTILIPSSVKVIGDNAFALETSYDEDKRKYTTKDPFTGNLLQVPNFILEGDALQWGISKQSIDNYKNSIRDNSGKIVLAYNKDRNITKLNNSNYYLVEEGVQKGIIEENGAWLIPLGNIWYSFVEIVPDKEKYVKVKTAEGFYGIMNLDGKEIISTSRGYTSIGDYDSTKGTFAFTKKGYTGVCDAQGKEISLTKLPPTANDIISRGGYASAVELMNGNTKYYKVSKNGRYGLTNSEGKVIIPAEMESLEQAGTGFLRFKLNGFYGIVNYAGKIIIPTDRGYTKIGDYVSFTKRFAYEMDGWKGECNNLGVQVSKIKVNKPVAQQTQTTTEKVVPNKPQKKDTIIIKHDPVPMQVWKKCDVCFGSGICQACVNIVWGQGSDRRCYGCGWSRKCQFCAGQGGHYEVEYR